MIMNLTVLSRHFGGDIYDLAEEILDRIDAVDFKADPYEALYDAMDTGMIYTADQWTMIEHYCTPQNADYDSAWTDFENELMDCLNEGVLELTEDEEEENENEED